MSDVQGIGPTQGPREIERKPGRTPPPPAPVSGKGEDAVQISEVARLASSLSQVPSVRAERVEEIKKAIIAGSYLTPEKIDKAIEALLKDVAG